MAKRVSGSIKPMAAESGKDRVSRRWYLSIIVGCSVIIAAIILAYFKVDSLLVEQNKIKLDRELEAVLTLSLIHISEPTRPSP